MRNFKVPLKNPKPDINNFLRGIKGEITPAKPLMCEYLIDDALMRPILVNYLGRTWIEKSEKTEYMGGQMEFTKEDIAIMNKWLDNQIAFWYHMGYDYVRVEVSTPLPAVSLITKDTATGNEDHNRAWQGMDKGPVQTWEDFEKYPWPEVNDDSFYIHNYICNHLPEGMGFISCHAGGVYEHVSRVMGYAGMCIAILENPDLVFAVTDKIGNTIRKYNDGLLQFDRLTAIFQGDDFGFKTGTLISPDDIRKYFIPWHKIYASQAHNAGRIYLLHSCGKIDDIMDDLVYDVKIDGKHSFQDDIMPIGEYRKKWGNSIALLGGVDVHKLSTYSPEDLRKYVRSIIDDCHSQGRFAIGAGNSITSYVPMNNYLTMIDEILK